MAYTQITSEIYHDLMDISSKSFSTPYFPSTYTRTHNLMVAKQIKAVTGINRHIIRYDISGEAYSNTRTIIGPEGNNEIELYVIAHECGHVYLGHPNGQSPYLDEIDTDQFARNILLINYGIFVPLSYEASLHRYFMTVYNNHGHGVPTKEISSYSNYLKLYSSIRDGMYKYPLSGYIKKCLWGTISRKYNLNFDVLEVFQDHL